MLRYLILILFPFLSDAQSDLAIGKWATHLPFNSGNFITQSNKFIYYSTEFAILKINKEDLSYERLTRTEGLSDSKIRTRTKSKYLFLQKKWLYQFYNQYSQYRV